MQKRPARVGFDETPTVAAALAWVRDGVDELARLAAEAPARANRGADWAPSGADTASGEGLDGPEAVEPAAPGTVAGHAPPPPPASRDLEAAMGELLFAAVALARQLRVNPEDALRGRAVSFADRFRTLETAARADGVDLHDLSPEEWRRRWEATA